MMFYLHYFIDTNVLYKHSSTRQHADMSFYTPLGNRSKTAKNENRKRKFARNFFFPNDNVTR